MGLLGCALFGVGDWLLGFVDPQPVSEVFSVLKAGHGADYPLMENCAGAAFGGDRRPLSDGRLHANGGTCGR